MTKNLVIGFTGTIASGKTVRCHRLLQIAIRHQLDALDATPPGVGTWQLSREEAVQLASSDVACDTPLTACQARYLPLLRNSTLRVGYLNADLLGHTVYLPGTLCYDQLIRHFGEAILTRGAAQSRDDDHSPSSANDNLRKTRNATPSGPEAGSFSAPLIDRRVLGRIVFADRSQLSALNTICRPHLVEAFRTRHHAFVGASAKAGKRVSLLILEAALLLEMAAMLHSCTEVWITSCSVAVATSRLCLRNSLTDAEATQRIAAQATLTEKLKTFRRMGLAGGLRHFDTSETTLEEGLRQVDVAFEDYWRDKIKPCL
ncbi:unnamed protein product [Phytomonas sp. Hart1]|nr:unnamed protein product [Phytomonas sp. Hart1]|eukprot:CCW69196.1 unnamed protein product [Phytomonas sp. isolate Hart1]